MIVLTWGPESILKIHISFKFGFAQDLGFFKVQSARKLLPVIMNINLI